MKPQKSAGIILLVLILASSAIVAAPGVAGPFQEQQPGDDDLSPVQLDLVGANIYEVIQIIGDTLELNYVIDQRVQGTVNINTSDTLRRADLLPILETILKINNASMVRTGNYYEILPAASAVRAPLEVRRQAVPESPDDRMVIQVIRLRFVSANEMSALLGAYLGEGASIAVHAGGNVLMVTERLSNLPKIMEVIDIFDAAVFENERVRMIPVQNARVADVVTDLQSVFSGYSLSSDTDGGGVRFIPLERLNSVLVIASVEDTFREVERWFERLDQPFANTGIRNYVYRVRNSKAADIQSVLSQLYGGALAIPSQSQAFIPLNALPGTEAAAPVQTPFGVVQPGGGQTTEGEDETRIIADSVTNSLIIHATPQEYEEILMTIEQLDLLPRQVLVDAQIYEVTLDDSLSFGVTHTLQNRQTLGVTETTASFAGSPPSLAATTFTLVGRTRQLVTFLNAAENRSRVRTISAPSVLVSDNMQAQFQVGAEIPIPTSSSITPVQAAGTNLFAQTIQFRETGVLLNVLPQINESGRVTLVIEQEISQAGANTTSDIVAPVIGKSSVTSTIVVQDGQTIALGGFIREHREFGRSRIPILGRIPVFGALFGNTRTIESRSELIILITPHVLRDFDDAGVATEELKSRLEEIQDLLDVDD